MNKGTAPSPRRPTEPDDSWKPQVWLIIVLACAVAIIAAAQGRFDPPPPSATPDRVVVAPRPPSGYYNAW